MDNSVFVRRDSLIIAIAVKYQLVIFISLYIYKLSDFFIRFESYAKRIAGNAVGLNK